MLAVDSFDLSNQLRPHMTTSDALSVGCPISSSWSSTPHQKELMNDEDLEVYDSHVLHDISKLNSLVPLFTDHRRNKKQQKILQSYYAMTDSAEEHILAELVDLKNSHNSYTP